MNPSQNPRPELTVCTPHQRAAFVRWSKPRPSFSDRFLKLFIRKEADECWLWIGRQNCKGYGSVSKDRRNRTAHRIAWEIANEQEAPVGMDVSHSCHNRLCVNPKHLKLATRSQNMLESSAVTRLPFQTNPEKCNLSKLTADDVRYIRTSDGTLKQLAKLFKVGIEAIRNVRNRKTWKRI